MGIEALGDLVVNIGVDASSLGSGLAGATDQVGKFGQDVAHELDGLSSGFDDTGKAAKSMADEWMNLKPAADDASAGFQGMADSLKQVGQEMKDAGTAMTAALTVPIVGLGAAALDAATTFDNALQQMARSTGAIGDQLAGMDATFKDVFANLPVSAGDAATAIDLLTQRLGVAGPQLDSLATQILNLATITGSQVGPLVDQATRAFNSWNISTADMARELDVLYTEAAKTGTPINQIVSQVVQFGPALREMGLSFDEATAMIAKFQAEGLNTGKMLQGLTFALRAMAKAGIDDPSQGLPVVIQMIKDAGSAGEANAIGIKVFGRGMTDLVEAIRSGKADIGDFVKQLDDSTLSINDVAEKTRTLSEKFTIFGHDLQTALEPLGETLLTTLKNLLDGMKPLLDIVGQLAKAFADLSPFTQDFILAIAAIAAGIGPLTFAIGAMTKGFGSLITLAGTGTTAFGGLSTVLTGIATAVGIAAAAFAGWKLGEWLKNNLGDVEDLTAGMKQQLTGILHTDTTSDKGFQDAMKLANQNVNPTITDPTRDSDGGIWGGGWDFAGKKQGLDDITARLKTLTQGALDAGEAVRAIKMKDFMDPEALAVLTEKMKVYNEEADKALKNAVNEQIAIDAERTALGDAASGWSDYQVIIASTQAALDNVTQSMHSQLDTMSQNTQAWTEYVGKVDSATGYVKTFGSTLTAIIADSSVGTLNTQMEANAKAFQDLGIKSKVSLETQWTEYNSLLKQGLLTTKEALLAEQKLLEESVQQEKENGQAVTSDQLARLAQIKQALKQFGVDPVWTAVHDTLSQAFKTLGDGLVKAMFDFKNFGKDIMGTLKQVGQEIVTSIIDRLILSKKNLDELSTKMTDMLKNMFGIKPSAGGGGMPGGIPPGGTSAGAGSTDPFSGLNDTDTPGIWGDASGGSGSSAAGGASGGIMGAVGAIGSVVGAISSIIGNFQMSHMNTNLGRIEVSTRRTDITLEGPDGVAENVKWLKGWPELNKGVQRAAGVLDLIHADTMDMVNKLRTIAGGVKPATAGGPNGGPGGGYWLQVTEPDATKILDSLIAELRRRGLKI
jgi:TP901 family phage tail tape measure protein